MTNILNLPNHFDIEVGDADKVMKILKKLKAYMEIVSTSYTVSSNSGIGTNVMFNVKVKMKNEDFSDKIEILHFDVTDYGSW